MRLLWLVGLLFAIEIKCQSHFRRLHFYIGSFQHVTRRYPTHNCCWEERDIEDCTSCPIRYKATSNRGTHDLGEVSDRIDTFVINQDLYFTHEIIQECQNFSITVVEYYTRNVIDLWTVSCLNLPPGVNYTVIDELGSFKNMKASFSILWECVGFAGPNCIKECNPNSRSYCDRNGDLICKDGFAGPPDCRLNSPCINSPCRNGGNCVASSTRDYRCECSQLFTGKNCEIARCDPLKCAGRCENGECVCTSDKVDPTCTSFSCEGNFLCQNNGTCGTLSGETFCVCPAHTSGAYCQFYCPEGCVNGRCVGDSRGNSVCQCFPNFVGSTCNIEIVENEESKPTVKELSVEAKVGIAFAAIFGMLSLCLIGKLVYDRYNTHILSALVNKNSDKVFHENDVSKLGEVDNI